VTDNIRTNFCPVCKEQADRIEAQAAEIQRLKEGLLAICQETTDSFTHDYAAELLEDD